MSCDKDNKAEDQESGATQPAEKPVSLHPLKFEEAVRDLIRARRTPGDDEGGGDSPQK